MEMNNRIKKLKENSYLDSFQQNLLKEKNLNTYNAYLEMKKRNSDWLSILLLRH
jgi:hypothetical protein